MWDGALLGSPAQVLRLGPVCVLSTCWSIQGELAITLAALPLARTHGQEATSKRSIVSAFGGTLM